MISVRSFSPKFMFFSLMSLFMVFSCQEEIVLDLENAEEAVVIEGVLTDEFKLQKLSIGTTIGYYEEGYIPPLEDATVRLFDEQEELVSEFFYQASDSLYASADSFALEVGQLYRLDIEAAGDLYQCNSYVPENGQLDSLYYLSDQQLEAIGQPTFTEGYYLFVNGSVSGDGPEYFRLTTTVNDTLQNSRNDISNSILSSEFFESEFQALPVPGVFEAKDTVDLTLYSMTEPVYQYYIEFSNLLFNDGGVFSPPPVNPTTNLVNTTNPDKKPLGYLQMSSVLRRRIIITEEKEE